VEDAFKEKKESKQDFFGLKDVLTEKDISENIDYILSQYSGREMAAIQIESYLNENPKLGKEYLTKRKLTTRDKLKAYLKNRQPKTRKKIVSEKKTVSKDIMKLKTELNMAGILSLAESESKRWDKMTEDYDKSQKKGKK
jgi:hypothetical protein